MTLTLREWQQHIDRWMAAETARVERECRRFVGLGIKPAITYRPMQPAEVIDARLAPDWAPHDVEPEEPGTGPRD